jgi:hypothetical protein
VEFPPRFSGGAETGMMAAEKAVRASAGKDTHGEEAEKKQADK